MTKTVPVREHDVKDELAAPGFPILARALAEVSRNFYDRGWVMGTRGNFSAVVSRDPLRLAITSTGAAKGLLSGEQIVQIAPAGKTIEGPRRPSTEARRHIATVRRRGADAARQPN